MLFFTHLIQSVLWLFKLSVSSQVAHGALLQKNKLTGLGKWVTWIRCIISCILCALSMGGFTAQEAWSVLSDWSTICLQTTCKWGWNSANTQPEIVNRGCFTDPFRAQAKQSHSFRGQRSIPKWWIWLLQVSSHLKFSFWLLGVPPGARTVHRTWPHQEGSSCVWLSLSRHSADCVAEPDPLGYGYFQGQLV